MFQTSSILNFLLYLYSPLQYYNYRFVFHNSDIFHKTAKRYVAIFRKFKAVGG